LKGIVTILFLLSIPAGGDFQLRPNPMFFRKQMNVEEKRAHIGEKKILQIPLIIISKRDILNN
jgi:hypothetical protein